MGKSIPIQTFSDEIVGWYLLCIYTPTNMYQFTDLHLAISNKLGWGDMLAEIALPAIRQIINGYANIILEVYGMPIESIEEGGDLYDAFVKDITSVSADNLFSYLMVQSVDDCFNGDDVAKFIKCRSAIENDMRMGFSYKTSIISEYIN